jgi:hypothetical protein
MLNQKKIVFSLAWLAFVFLQIKTLISLNILLANRSWLLLFIIIFTSTIYIVFLKSFYLYSKRTKIFSLIGSVVLSSCYIIGFQLDTSNNVFINLNTLMQIINIRNIQ